MVHLWNSDARIQRQNKHRVIRAIRAKQMKHKELTAKIIECAYKVHNILGFGFLEAIYQNALLIELLKAGLQTRPIVPSLSTT